MVSEVLDSLLAQARNATARRTRPAIRALLQVSGFAALLSPYAGYIGGEDLLGSCFNAVTISILITPLTFGAPAIPCGCDSNFPRNSAL